MRQPSANRTTLYDCRHCLATLPSARRFFPRHGCERAALAYWNDLQIVHGAAFAALGSIGIGDPLKEPRNLFTGLKAMYRPVSPHGDRGDAVKGSDLITIEGGKSFVVLLEKGGNLDFKCFRHRFPPRL
jgi:hypothetical protein